MKKGGVMFWMVYVEEMQTPRYRHQSIEEARIEAARLARSNPGKRVYVLVTVEQCEVKDVHWHKMLSPDGLPF